MAVARDTYREAMARLGAAVNVITSDGPGGRGGLTASAVCSVTDNPPTLLICINRTSDNNALFRTNGVVCVNTLAHDHEELSRVFAGSVPVAKRFETGSWGTLATGAPVLEGAAVSFDCRITEATEVGTHTVFFCEVEAISLGAATECLIYFSRTYHKLAGS